MSRPAKVTCRRCGGLGLLRTSVLGGRRDVCPVCGGEGKAPGFSQAPDRAHGVADAEGEGE